MISNYVKVVTVTIQAPGALLDHVFVRKDLSKKADVKNVVIKLHFSNCDAVRPARLFKIGASNMLHQYNSH